MKKFRPYITILLFYISVSIILLGALVLRYHYTHPEPKGFDSTAVSFDGQNPYHYPPLPSRFVSQYPGEPTPTPIIPYEIPKVLSDPDLTGKILYLRTDYEVNTKSFIPKNSGLYVTDKNGTEKTQFISFTTAPLFRDAFRFSNDRSVLAWSRENHLEYILLHEDKLSVRTISLPKENEIRSFSFIPNSNNIVVLNGETFEKDIHKTVNTVLTTIDTQTGNTTIISLPSTGTIYYPFFAVFDENTFIVLTENNKQYSLQLLKKGDVSFTSKVLKTFSVPVYAFDAYEQKVVFVAWVNRAAEMYLYDNTTGELLSLPNLQIGDYVTIGQVAFSHSGKKIVFNFGAGDVTRNAVYDIDARKSQILDFGSFSYALSTDEQTIIGTTKYNSSQLELYTIASANKKIIDTGKDQFVFFNLPFWYPQ